MEIPHDLFIDGSWTPASDGGRMDVIDPATEEPVDTIAVATTDDVDRALEAAERGFRTWREVDAWSRSSALRRIADFIRAHVDTFAEVLTAEQGKPLPEAAGELRATADQFDWYADEARRVYGRVLEGHSRAQRLLVIRQPIGPVAAFSPWNFPALLSARKIAPALATGCSIVLKPAEEAPRTALMLALACEAAEIPDGVVNVLTGNPEQISRRLVASDVVRKVSLTGSVPVGRTLAHLCAELLKPISLELGGHSPVLVFEDSDVESAAETCARAKFRNNGQVCISASRFFVHESVAEAFTRRFVDVARSLRVGHGREAGTDVGPLSNRRRLEATQALVDDAVGKGAELCCGGKRPEGSTRGFFFEPTVLGKVDASMRVMSEEPFGPIAPITTFASFDEAIERANQTEYGLAGYVFTENTRTAFRASERLDVGMVGVNHLVIATAEAPFGGVKISGQGREGGSEGIDAYTVTKYVNVQL